MKKQVSAETTSAQPCVNHTKTPAISFGAVTPL
jgi:hypothetical protein